MAGRRHTLLSLLRGKKSGGEGRTERPDPASAASSSRASNDTRQERSGDSLVILAHDQESSAIQTPATQTPTTQLPGAQSLWDRAYDALAKNDAELVKDYEKLLAKEEQADSASDPAQPKALHDVSHDFDNPSRQARLNTVIEQGLQRIENAKGTYTIAGHNFVLTDQITKAAKLLLWAKGWIGDAVEASPQASVVWAGVCLVLPLLTNPTTASEANRDGFDYVTTRMRYYIALEPLLGQLSQNNNVTKELMSEADNHIVDLYQHILEFQLYSVLRFYKSRAGTYLHDMIFSKDWKQMTVDIKEREELVNRDLSLMNEFVARQKLEALNKLSTDDHEVLNRLLSLSTQQLAISTQQLHVLQELQQDSVRQKLSDEQQKCLQLFYRTEKENGATYDWYKSRVEDRLPGTCEWFLQHDGFKVWLEQDSGPLLISADPGCGKSVLAKYLIDCELVQQRTAICYFFFKDQDQNTASQALCAILHQLLSQKQGLIQHAIPLYRTMGPALVKSAVSLWKILGDALQDSQAGPVTIVLDALDECDETELKDLVRNVERLMSNKTCNAKLKILLTSRPYTQVVSKFRRLSHIRIPGEDDDETKMISQEITVVIDYRVEQLSRDLDLSDEIKTCLQNRLLQIQHRTYLWVYLVFDYLETGFNQTSDGIDEAIQSLPQSVDEAYERILNKSRKDPIVRRVLSIILAASGSLTLSEMKVALRINPLTISDARDTENINRKVLPISSLKLEADKVFKLRLRSWCGLFISIHHGRVYFLHQTAREFLIKPPSPTATPSVSQWKHSITICDAHAVLTEICVLYLSMFNSEEKSTSYDDDERGAFIGYSASYWGFHFHEANIDDPVLVYLASRLGDPFRKSNSIWSVTYRIVDSDFPDRYTGIIVASYFGLNSVVEFLLEKGADINSEDNRGKGPLSYAALKGHEAVVRLLLDKGADIESKDKHGRTPLWWAARRGDEAVIRLLLEKGVDIESKDKDGRTPLWWAAQRGNEAVVRLLLEKGADIESKDKDGQTPLWWAAQSGDEAVIRLLLEKGADIESKGKYGQTPLWSAARRGDEAVIRLLLEKGADIEFKDKYGGTPLWWAAQRGDEAVIRLLLEKGADIESKDKDGQTPLWWAAQSGDEAVIRLLLEKGADIESKDKDGRTPLWWAAQRGDEAVIRLLLEKGADIESKDKDGRTPLWYAQNSVRALPMWYVEIKP